jgi:4-alpha-glucanotransferase
VTQKRRALGALARAYGIQLSHRDGRGRLHRPSTDALVAVLRALDAPVDSDPDAPAAAGTQPPPVVVAWDGKVDMSGSDDTATWVLRLEDGTERRWSSRGGEPVDALPLGYHDLDRADGASTRIIAAPRRAPLPSRRAWGVFLPLYALHSERSMGIGDLSDLEALLSWTNKQTGSFVGTLPLYAAFLDDPEGDVNVPPDPSPYAPVSRLFFNETYVDPERTPEFDHCHAARELASSSAFRAGIDDLRRAALVDHVRAYRLKRRMLEMLADVADVTRVRAFSDTEPLVRDYASFRARVETSSDGPSRARAERYHLYAQLVAHEQLAAVASTEADAGLHLDLPLGVHPDGFDVHRFGDAFAQGVSVGAPPDDLAPGGQDWGFPPLHPRRIRADGHSYFAAVVAKAARAASVLRVDHVLGLHRQYWIPDGSTSDDGVYVRYPSDELYAVLALEAHRAQTVVVGEDLGTLPREVRPAMRRHGILSTYVLQFSTRDDDRAPIAAPPSNVLACVNTHDTETFAAFWQGLDDDRRRAIVAFLSSWAELGPDAEATDVLRAVVRYLAASGAPLVQVSLEDLWGEVQPQNVPGTTTDERPNWRRKARLSLEQMTTCSDVAGTLAHVARARERSEAG